MNSLRSTKAPNTSRREFENLPDLALVRMPTVLAVTGLSRPTIWRRERDGTFPAKVRIGPASVGQRVGDLRRWLAEPEQPVA